MPTEYLVLIRWDSPPDPDDPRPLRVQLDEMVDGLLALVADSSGAAWAEVLAVHDCGGGPEPGR